MSDDKDISAGDNAGSGDDRSGAPDTGKPSGDWRSNLPPELATAPYFRSAKNLEQAVSDLSAAAANAGNSLRIPGPDADEDALNKFYDKIQAKAPQLMRRPDSDEAYQQVLRDLGMPEEASKYALPEVDGIKLADERIGELKAMAHEAGLTGKQFDGFMKSMLTKEAADLSATQTARESDIAQLRGEWGAAADQRYGEVARLLEATGAAPELIEAVNNRHVDAQTMRWFHSMADKMGSGGEGAPLGGQGKGEPAPIMTPAEATLQLGELESKLIGKRMPADQQAVLMKRRMELMKLAYPDT